MSPLNRLFFVVPRCRSDLLPAGNRRFSSIRSFTEQTRTQPHQAYRLCAGADTIGHHQRKAKTLFQAASAPDNL